ncbi:hypothetical protein UFOVP898_58 [uncultured Caudovirales phage]|uniref:Uncharacterized protein n=1 Tax=uncultured Caudovirales phage TaxID=2100421 RepID=A0A6J5QC46_9CAUD|nr:hypothetical protein UFOVP898_58 [uncultured Caudovirales phage]CAB4176060.1 hypothetical protein UFOVP985_1 [uncultured Caudovirales phage]CAB4181713.1 hypothetical protein UFOVP1073_56 [uncultured Caudovirales phage]CAB4197589.1 hypothetical protein UFOVP1308_21 [uncultured Caudovirales phage]CAB4210792.1 hypothetical protein UFOVP1423_48 [uncultured Caudovirales phage]
MDSLHNDCATTMTFVLLSAVYEAKRHRPLGYLAEVLNAGTAVSTIDGDFLDIPDEVYDSLVEKYSGTATRKGPGSVLHRVLESMGIESLPGCKCLQRKTIMDQWGWEECQKPERVNEIVGWLKEEAEARGLPFVTVVARAAIVTGLAVGSRVYGDSLDRKDSTCPTNDCSR